MKRRKAIKTHAETQKEMRNKRERQKKRKIGK